MPTGAKRDEIDRVRKSLPIYRAKDKLMEEIRRSETIIIIGETGSGRRRKFRSTCTMISRSRTD